MSPLKTPYGGGVTLDPITIKRNLSAAARLRDFRRTERQFKFLHTFKLDTRAEVSMFAGTASDEAWRLGRELRKLRAIERVMDAWKVHNSGELELLVSALLPITLNRNLSAATRRRQCKAAIRASSEPLTFTEVRAKIAELESELGERRDQLKLCVEVEEDAPELRTLLSEAKRFAAMLEEQRRNGESRGELERGEASLERG